MRKIITILLLLILIIAGCEKDDFCTQNPVTPNLVLSFYDANNRETLKSVEIYVWAEGKDSIYEGTSQDSIFVPLNSMDIETSYNFSVGNVVNQFTIKYTPDEKYVSRSCGFRILFNEVTFTSDNTWITDFTPETLTTIDNQNEAHVQIFH